MIASSSINKEDQKVSVAIIIELLFLLVLEPWESDILL